jgi:hypothetical protein
VRLSCGVEAPEDLVDDLRLAFERAAGAGADGGGAQRSAAGQAMR